MQRGRHGIRRALSGLFVEQLEKVAGNFLWLENNRHNYRGSPEWLEYFDAAVIDAKEAILDH